MNENRNRQAVVLLHGLWTNGLVMQYLARKLAAEGYAACSINYPSMRGRMDEHVALVARRIAAIGSERIHLVGHSLGGVVALRYLQADPDVRIGRAVLLGAPVTGSQAALKLARSAPGRLLLGRSLSLWRGAFNTALDSGREVGAIAGTRPFGLGRVVVPLPAPGDGVVLVDETRLPGLADHLALPVSHTGMLISGRVARQVAAFLARGRFER